MEITQYLNALVAMIPDILQYVVPGVLMLWVYNRLLDKQLPQHYLIYSVIISFLLMQVVPTKKLQYIVACVLGAILSILRRSTKVKRVLLKLFKWSPSSDVWEDIIDYELGTYMMVATNDENGFKGYYAGLATEKNMLFLSEYTVTDDHGHELVTIDDQMAQLGNLIVNGVSRLLSKLYVSDSVTAPSFIGKLTGNADTATKLTSSAGSATQPVYFSDGKPVATTYTLGKSVPASAVFTDTNTWRGVQNNLTSTATDQSLSAAQGKVLKDLVDGKAPASHTHSQYYDSTISRTKG